MLSAVTGSQISDLAPRRPKTKSPSSSAEEASTCPRLISSYCASAPSPVRSDRHHHDWVAGDVWPKQYGDDTVSRDYQTGSRTVKPACTRVL